MICLYSLDVAVAVTEHKDLAAGGKRNCIVKTTIVTELTHTQVIDEADATTRTWVGQTRYFAIHQQTWHNHLHHLRSYYQFRDQSAVRYRESTNPTVCGGFLEG